jgi:hypothetical protein
LKVVGNEISPIIHLRLETSRGSPDEDEEILEQIVNAVSCNIHVSFASVYIVPVVTTI